jgi:hypothetical protein
MQMPDNTRLVYVYDPVTKEFVYSYYDPENSAMPVNSTLIAPATMDIPAGYKLVFSGTVWNAVIPASTPLTSAKELQLSIINAAADAAFSAITAPYPKQEVDTWPNQYAEATAFTANPLAPAPTLSAIATAMGSTVAALAPIVLQKAAAYTAASGAVVGRRKLLTAQVQAATTVAQVQAVIW